MNRQPESIEALRLKCILLELKVQKLQLQLETEENKNRHQQRMHEEFWTWIRDRKNYIWWRISTLNKAAA